MDCARRHRFRPGHRAKDCLESPGDIFDHYAFSAFSRPLAGRCDPYRENSVSVQSHLCRTRPNPSNRAGGQSLRRSTSETAPACRARLSLGTPRTTKNVAHYTEGCAWISSAVSDVGCVGIVRAGSSGSHTQESSSANKGPLRRRKFWLESPLFEPSPGGRKKPRSPQPVRYP